MDRRKGGESMERELGKRILIIGGNGSGKTTMARSLSHLTSLPLVHLDTLYWTDGWVPRQREAFLLLLQKELEREEWILDGNMRRTLPHRLLFADTVIFLDFSGIACFFGTVKRLLQNRGKTRTDMGGKCIENIDLRSLKFIFSTLSFNRKNRDYFYHCIDQCPQIKSIVLKNRRAVKKFLLQLENNSKT